MGRLHKVDQKVLEERYVCLKSKMLRFTKKTRFPPLKNIFKYSLFISIVSSCFLGIFIGTIFWALTFSLLWGTGAWTFYSDGKKRAGYFLFLTVAMVLESILIANLIFDGLHIRGGGFLAWFLLFGMMLLVVPFRHLYLIWNPITFLMLGVLILIVDFVFGGLYFSLGFLTWLYAVIWVSILARFANLKEFDWKAWITRYREVRVPKRVLLYFIFAAILFPIFGWLIEDLYNTSINLFARVMITSIQPILAVDIALLILVFLVLKSLIYKTRAKKISSEMEKIEKYWLKN